MPTDESPALALIEHYEKYEPELIGALTGTDKASELKSIHWKETGDLIYLPYWRKTVQDHFTTLQGKTVGDIYDLASKPKEFANRVTSETQTPEEEIFTTVNLLGAALAVTLVDHGWIIRADLGENIRLENNGEFLEPFGLVGEVAKGTLAKNGWDQKFGSNLSSPISVKVRIEMDRK
jgi:hypothetical protein